MENHNDYNQNRRIGLRIPILNDGSDIVDLPIPGATRNRDNAAMLAAIALFIVSAATLAHFAKTEQFAITWPCFAATVGSLLFIGRHLDIEEARIHEAVRKMKTVEREVVIGDDFDGVRIATGTIRKVVETERYIVMYTGERNGKCFAYVAPKIQMTDDEIGRLLDVMTRCVRDVEVIGLF